MSFKRNKYKVLKQAISKELAEFVYTYFLNKRRVARFLFDQNIYHRLLIIGVYGMINKFLIHTLIMEI